MHPFLTRTSDSSLSLANPQNIPATIVANAQVEIGNEGVNEALTFLSVADTINQITEKHPEFWQGNPAKFNRLILTPDFHKGAGIPIGTVAEFEGAILPQAPGNDIGCGMRLLGTDVKREEILANIVPLKKKLREIFFEGKRDIPMSPGQRSALLREGLMGLALTAHENINTGIWKYYDVAKQAEDTRRVHFQGTLPTDKIFAFDDYIKGSGKSDSRDAHIGSVGGTNHFTEIQYVDEIFNGYAANLWGLKPGCATIMAHSGSLGLGHAVGGYFTEKAKEIYPSDMKRPDHGFYVIPAQHKLAKQYLSAMWNAANFSFGNRLFLGLMVVKALHEVLGRDIETNLVYDAPHNLIWSDFVNNTYLHRKGACPAQGFSSPPFDFTGNPVIIPGSMGDASYVMNGSGNVDLLESACHGAGRSVARGATRHIDQATYEKSVEKLHVITPIDPDSYQVKSRRDILDKYHDRVREEAPYAYKPITPVIESVESAKIAQKVVKLLPILTIKG